MHDQCFFFQRSSLMMTVRRCHNSFSLHTRRLKHPGRTEDTQSHRQRARRAELWPRPADSGPARPGRCLDPRGCCPAKCHRAGKRGRRGVARAPSRAAPRRLAGREESIRSGLVLMPEECLEKSCLSPLYLTHHLPVSRSVREELP